MDTRELNPREFLQWDKLTVPVVDTGVFRLVLGPSKRFTFFIRFSCYDQVNGSHSLFDSRATIKATATNQKHHIVDSAFVSDRESLSDIGGKVKYTLNDLLKMKCSVEKK